MKPRMAIPSLHDTLQREQRRPDRTLSEPTPSERLVEAFDDSAALLAGWVEHEQAEAVADPAEVLDQRAGILRRLRHELFALLFSPLWPYAVVRRFVGYTALSITALVFGWLLVSLIH